MTGRERGTTLEPDFAGQIGPTAATSTPWWPQRSSGQRPNVVVILLDDVGFAQVGCYGGSIATPNIDALAASGLRFTNFHVAALCSPTRASLLTGRNHHSVGMGFLAAFDTGYPGYRAAISPAAATLSEMLGDAGYGSYATGKWHLTPPTGMSAAGPFDQWPTQRGFDRYYGFLWGEDDMFAPELWYDQHRVDPPARKDYHFSEDMTDRTIEFLADHLTSRPGQPFFSYVAFAACHAPHQAPRSYIDRYAGRFDHGWDEERRRILNRQIELGVVPNSTSLSPRNPDVPAWDELSPAERRTYVRLQEAFAGYMEHADEQIGRLVAFLRDQSVLDDTVVVLLSDNGASGEGGRNGTINEYRYFLGLEDELEDAIAAIDDIGGPRAHNQYPSGWAQAGNTPLRYYKRFAHAGGVRAPLIVHWPSGIEAAGEVRPQFHHAIDVAATILDLTETPAPDTYRGVTQLPIHGTSMRSSFDAERPSSRTTQYFETAGNRAVVADGWKAVAAHAPGTAFDDDDWELYEMATDVSEVHDRAAAHPEVLARLQRLWWEEAERFGVLPLDDRMGERVRALDPAMDRRRYRMLPGTRYLNHVVGPSFSERPFDVIAEVECGVGDEGVLLAYGRRAFGFSLFLKDGRVMLDYNLAGRHTKLSADERLPAGHHMLRLEVRRAEESRARLRLLVDDRTVAEGSAARLVPGGIGTLSIQCGHNAPSPVSDEYVAPFTFTGTLYHVTIDLGEREESRHPRAVQAEMAFE